MTIEDRTVKLQYFKQSGKYYSQAEYTAAPGLEAWDVCREVREMRQNGKLPGLMQGAGGEFDILCEFNGVPHLLKTIHPERPEGA